MKKTNLKYILGAFLVLFSASSCEDRLDINENPNSATKADVNLVLPQAIVSSASVSSQFNNYGAHFGGYMANAGGFSGFGNLLNYNLTPGDWNGLWTTTYQDPLADLNYVIETTDGVDELAYYNAAAKIMTVVNYQRLVDAFGNIPYTEALRADEGIVTPAYDDAATVYQDLFAKLDQAITSIQSAAFPRSLTAAADPLFEGDMDSWLQYANTLKLRILIRMSSKSELSSFVSTGFANLNLGIGFLADDAIVDPGYEVNKPNPAWNTWGRTPALALSNSSRIPTRFAFGFYNGAKLNDPDRGEALYVNYPATPVNQLGNENGAPTVVSNTVTWASNEPGLTGLGILKGAGMGQPLMLRAESEFLQAEAKLRGFIAGGDAAAKVNFENGIKASFAYTYKDDDENLSDTTGLVADYIDGNSGSYLANWDIATSDAQKLEAIITQKYIAVNMINSDEGYNEYRRTGFPATSPGNANPALDIASNKSNVTRADRLPTRILYPSTEQSFNASNYRDIDFNSELIFWDPS